MVCVILGGLVLLLVTLENITEACHHTVRPYPSEGSDLGRGVITPVVPVAPTGPMAANVRVVSDPQGGNYVSDCPASSKRLKSQAEASIPLSSLSIGSLHEARMELNPSFSMAERKRLSRRIPRVAEPLS